MEANGHVNKPHMNWDQIVQPCGKVLRKDDSPKPKATKAIGSMQLGTYNAAVTPLLVLVVNLITATISTKDMDTDPRSRNLFLLDRFWTVSSISVLYIMVSVVWGPKLMEGRKPYQLKKFMLCYNAFQVVLSFYMFAEGGFSGWFYKYNWRCQPSDRSLTQESYRMPNVAYLFFLSKILDFVDTALFILRGKLDQVTMLHVIHHSCMVTSMWFGVLFEPDGHNTFLGFLNSFIHTVMYSYYLLAGLGPKVQPYLWWKKYLTRMQLIQFVAIFVHVFQLFIFPCEGVSMGLAVCTMLYAFLFFALFINFYFKAYIQGGRLKSKETAVAEKSLMPNGHLSSSSNGIAAFMNGRVTHRVPNSSSITE